MESEEKVISTAANTDSCVLKSHRWLAGQSPVLVRVRVAREQAADAGKSELVLLSGGKTTAEYEFS